jgi:hypothetical protein
VYITNTPKAMIKTAVTEEALERVMSRSPQPSIETRPDEPAEFGS